LSPEDLVHPVIQSLVITQPRDYKVLFSEGDTPGKALLDAAETTGGAEYYLIEQEGSRFPALETVEKCLANFRKFRPKA
jgi:hypothetical protein